MTSQRKIAANPQTDQKSTEPERDYGTQRTRRSAVKHGLFAEQLLITGENFAKLSTLHDELLGALRPQNFFEEMIAGLIVRDAWRLNRIDLAEQAYLEQIKDAVLQETIRASAKTGRPSSETVHSGQAQHERADNRHKSVEEPHIQTCHGRGCYSKLESEIGHPSQEGSLAAQQDGGEVVGRLGLVFLQAIVPTNERLPIAELDRLRRGLVRDIMRKHAALDELQSRRTTINSG